MTTRTLSPTAIDYVVRRYRTVMRAVDTDAALHGTRLGAEPLDEAVRHSGTDIIDGAVGAYSIVHGDADVHSEVQIAFQQAKRGVFATDDGYGFLGTVTTTSPDGTTTVRHPGALGRPVGARNGADNRMPNKDRTYLSRARSKARKDNPNATDEQIESVAQAALAAKQERDRKSAADRPTTEPKTSVDARVLATASGSWADGN